MPRPRSAPANPFEALASQQQPGSPGSRRQKKAERAKEHRQSTSLPSSPVPATPLGTPAADCISGTDTRAAPPRRGSMGLGASVPQGEQPHPPPVSQHAQQSTSAAQQRDSTLHDGGSGQAGSRCADGRQPASFASPTAAAVGTAGHAAAAQAPDSPADIDGLMSLLLGGSSALNHSPVRSTTPGGSSCDGRSSGGPGRQSRSASAAASPAPPVGMSWPASQPQQQQQQQPASDWQLAAAMQQQEVAAARGSGGAAAAAARDDWRLAAELQQQEDAAAAAAKAAAADAAFAAAAEEAARDEQLARQWQEEEDARVAAAIAAEEEAGASAAATAAATASSANFWSALQLHDAEEASAAGRVPLHAPAPSQRRQGAPVSAAVAAAGSSRSSDAAVDAAFPSLQAAAGGCRSGRGSGPGSDTLRQALLRDHRGAAQRALERGSGVRLLHRGEAGGSPASRPPLHSGSSAGGSWLGSPASEGGSLGVATPWGLPPLRLDDGGQLLEDDLDYQLLLRPDGVSEAAAAAAARIAQREAEAASAAGGPAASAEALRAMMDASSRGAAGGSRPGSAGGAGAAPWAAASGSRPGSAGGEGWEGGDEDELADVHDVDTKSLRRLVEDMRRRGWRMQPSGGGHIKCERPYQDVDGAAKLQVYFLCSTPSDVAYIHNVKAAVKRFDRQLLEIRAAAAAAAAGAAASSASQGNGGGRPGG